MKSKNQNVTKLFDGSTSSKWFADGFNGKLPAIIIWEYDQKYGAKAYSLTSGNDVPGRDPQSWKFYGSADGKSYTLLDKQANITFADRNDTREFPLKSTVNYKFYKLEITKIASGMPPQLSEIELVSTADVIPELSDDVEIVSLTIPEAPKALNITSNCDNTKNQNQKVDKLFDGNMRTKWYAEGFSGTFPCFIAWEYAKPLAVKSYTLTSGNDVPARDPKAWNLYGSNDGQSYTLIDKQENVTFDRSETKEFDLAKAANYKYFKFEIMAVMGGSTPPQLSEIELK